MQCGSGYGLPGQVGQPSSPKLVLTSRAALRISESGPTNLTPATHEVGGACPEAGGVLPLGLGRKQNCLARLARQLLAELHGVESRGHDFRGTLDLAGNTSLKCPGSCGILHQGRLRLKGDGPHPQPVERFIMSPGRRKSVERVQHLSSFGNIVYLLAAQQLAPK